MNRASCVVSASSLLVLGLGVRPTLTTAAGDSWRAVTCLESSAAIERVRCGRPDRADAALQAVSVDQAGDVALMHFAGEQVRAEIVYKNGAELSALSIGDVDPFFDGPEIYVGGFLRSEEHQEVGGAVYQLALERGAPARARTVFSATSFVHSVERIEPQTPGASPELLVCTYAGEIQRLRPSPGTGVWEARLLYREPPSADAEAVKIKDAAFLRDASRRAPHEALVALKLGRLLHLDLDAPERTHLIHTEPGGLSRITPDEQGGAYVTGYAGRVLRLVRAGEGWRVDVLDQEGADSGLRGLVRGRFPVDGGVAHLAIFGFHRRCRALVERLGVLDPVTLYIDSERGHTIEAADLIPGNDADEILIGGYSQRVCMLVRE